MSEIVSTPEVYFRQFTPSREEVLQELEAEARLENIPIAGPIVGELLSILVQSTQALHILELGTATGYSAIYLSEACNRLGCRLITVEKDPAMANRAQATFERLGLSRRIELREGDAMEIMARMGGPYDLIFMDIEKEDYIRALPHCKRLLRKGGLLIVDNVAFENADPFNRAISESPSWRAVNLFSFLPLHSPEYDAICFALRV